MSTILTIYKCSQHAEADFSYFYPTIDTLLSCETASTQVCKDLFLYDYTTFANIQKKKASNFWLHTCKCPATQSITWDIHQDTLKTQSYREITLN